MKRTSSSPLFIRTPLLLAVLSLSVTSATAEYINSIYKEGDWVSFTDFSLVNSLDLDHRVLYAGTSGGVLRYNYVQRKWETPLTTSDGLPGGEVLVVAFDPERGDLWCGTRAGLGVYNIDLKSWRVYGRAQGLGGEEILEIVIGMGDNSGYVYVKTPGTWNRFRKGSDFSERISAGSVPRGDEIKRRGSIDRSVYNSDRYPFLNSTTDPDEHLRTFAVTSVVEDGWGNLWVGTAGGGIYSVSMTSYIWKNHRFGLVSRSVTAIEKNVDSIWFGGGDLFSPGGGGLTGMSRDMTEWKYHEQEYTRELGRSEINDLKTIGKDVWVASSIGLIRYDTTTDQWSRFQRRNGLPHDHVLCLDSQGDVLWAGTRTGAVRVDTDSLTFSHLSGIPPIAEVQAIEATDNRVWVGTDMGLFFTKEDSMKARSPGLSGRVLTADIRDLSYWRGSLFIATTRGLYRYDEADGRVISDPHPGSVTGVRLLSIAVDSLNLWIGTDTGVERFKKDMGNWVSYRPGNYELLSSPVTDILIDGSYVWFATPEGTTRFYWDEPFRSR